LRYERPLRNLDRSIGAKKWIERVRPSQANPWRFSRKSSCKLIFSRICLFLLLLPANPQIDLCRGDGSEPKSRNNSVPNLYLWNPFHHKWWNFTLNIQKRVIVAVTKIENKYKPNPFTQYYLFPILICFFIIPKEIRIPFHKAIWQ